MEEEDTLHILRFHWWQQILRYHNRIDNLPDGERLIQMCFCRWFA